MEEFIDTTIPFIVTAWFDNKEALTLSDYIGKELTGEYSRFNKKQQKRIQVNQTRLVSVYNKFMGGVD